LKHLSNEELKSLQKSTPEQVEQLVSCHLLNLVFNFNEFSMITGSLLTISN